MDNFNKWEEALNSKKKKKVGVFKATNNQSRSIRNVRKKDEQEPLS